MNEKMLYGLRDSDLTWLTNIFKTQSSIERVILFGSRAMGNYKKSSDIDLAFEGDFAENELAHIRSLLDDTGPLPFKFDLLDFKRLNNQELKDHILREGKSLYQRSQA